MFCLIYDSEKECYRKFENPVLVSVTSQVDQVKECLSVVENSCRQGRFAVVFVSYEAAPAFDNAFLTEPPGDFPLVCFGIFDSFQWLPLETAQNKIELSAWYSSLDETTYLHNIQKIKHHIAEGDTYQVNYTFKLFSEYTGNPKELFLDIQGRLRARYAAYMELEDLAICSFSPELFFRYENKKLISKPMKGTAKRGLTLAEDQQNMLDLANSVKDQAENIMIVDMIRNDMGRIAKTGSVTVSDKFAVERFPYVLQMTSNVEAEVSSSLVDIFEALFPCGSITGAPKVSTMKIINELEEGPRKVYTGTIGWVDPDGSAQFNVAIRTIVNNLANSTLEYGVGSGIVWDSVAENEYKECLLKADFLKNTLPDFQLIESLLWTEESGFFLLGEHLERLQKSAVYFDYNFNRQLLVKQLNEFGNTIKQKAAKVRCLLDKKGQIVIEAQDLYQVKSDNLTVGLAKEPVDSKDCFLYHKSTQRSVYEKAKASRPDCDDVILWNEKGEITESCRSNVVVEIEGEYLTPPISCGCLAGTFRQFLLKSGEIKESIVSKEMLKQSNRIFTINSVRRWMSVQLI